MRGLTDRAKANQHKQERKEETRRNKRMRLAKGENGTRRVSDQPEQGPGGGAVGITTTLSRHNGKETPRRTRWTGNV
eukprot:6188546-Pleurochrysis_carterae.AAC.2